MIGAVEAKEASLRVIEALDKELIAEVDDKIRHALMKGQFEIETKLSRRVAVYLRSKKYLTVPKDSLGNYLIRWE